MKIRHATPDDLPALRRMGADFHAASCYADTVPANLDSFEKTIVNLFSVGNGVVLVAEDAEGVLCGMAGGVVQPHWFNHDHLAGQEMFWWVDESTRGSGAGFKLMDALEQWAIAKGCKTFCMASTANLTPEKLARIYKRRGYVAQDIYYAKVINHA